MKVTRSRMWRSVVSMLLALCLVVGLTPAAFATGTEETIKLVSLGDSMANGYGLEGYYHENGAGVNGYLQNDTAAYPALFADWLETATGKTVEHTQLAISAMRAEDLHFILEYGMDGAYAGDAYTQDEFVDHNGRFNDYANIDASLSGTANVANKFQNSVADADIITMGVGNANFGVFMLGRVMNALRIMGGDPEEDAWINFEDALRECDAETKAAVMGVYNTLKAELAKQVSAEAAAIVDPMVNAMAYTIVSYVLNYAGVVERVVALNPDAEIMIVGLMNTLSGMKIKGEYEGAAYEIDLGACMDSLISAMNLYLAAQPAAFQAAGKYPEATFYYAEASNVNMVADTYAIAAEDWGNNTVIRDRFIEEVCDTVFPYLSAMGLVTIDRATVEAYEKGTDAFSAKLNADGKMGDAEKIAKSCVVYLAFEEAVVEASKLEALNVNSFLTLYSGLDGVFNGVLAAYEKYTTTKIEFEDNMTVPDGYNADGTMKDQPALVRALTEDETVCGLLNLFARMLIGNGIGCHPSAAGHQTLSTAVINAYQNGETASDHVVSSLEELYKLIEEYGPEILEDVYAYAEEQGYIAELEAAIEELKTELEATTDAYIAEIKPEIEAAIAEVEAKIAELEAELDAAIAELEAELEAKREELENAAEELKAEIEAEIAAIEAAIEEEIAAVQAAIEAAYAEAVAEIEALMEELKAELEAKVDEVLAAIKQQAAELGDELGDAIVSAIDEINAAVAAKVDDVVTEIEKILTGAADAAIENLTAAIEALVDETAAVVNAEIEKIVAAFEAAYAAATTGEYTITEDSYYVAIGDASAVSESYVDELAAELEIDYKNLAQEGTIEDAPAVIQENAAEIAKADLITVGYSNNAFTKEAAEQMYAAMNGAAVAEYDWAAFVGEEGAAYIDEALNDIYEELVANGMDVTIHGYKASLATAMTMAVETYAYGAVTYATYLPEVVNAIHKINPDALVIVVGMYNPLDGAAIQYEDSTIEIGEYVGYLVEAAKLHGVSYAMLTGNAIYVEAPDAETELTGDTLEAIPFVMNELIIGKCANMNPNANGYTYIKDQIINALNITEEEDDVLLGDVNFDGVVNAVDLNMIFRYVSGVLEFSDLQKKAGDVNLDGTVNPVDLNLVFRYVSGVLESF